MHDAPGEFELIARWFTRPTRRAVLGVGDDAALLAAQPGRQWAVSTDLLVEGRHFLPTVAPDRLGHKSLAVNLSDLAAMGARPVAYTLALALPRVDPGWLDGFAHGLHALADAHDIELVGGDTTMGPLTIGITVFGDVPDGQALRRDGANDGDRLWVSHPPGGGLGDGRLALETFRGRFVPETDRWPSLRDAMERPQPRVALGIALRGIATAAIDLSDGLLGDVGHLARRSRLRVVIDAAAVPCSPSVAALPEDWRRRVTLGGGDDYELAFAAPPSRDADVRAAAGHADVAVTPIGRFEAGQGVVAVDATGQPIDALPPSFDHFRSG